MSNIRLGISLPWLGSSWSAGESMAPSILFALNEASERGILSNHSVTWTWIDQQCDPEYAPLASKLVDIFDPHVFIGPGCSIVQFEMAASSSLSSIPQISWGVSSLEFSDKVEHPNFSRVVSSYESYNRAVTELAVSSGISKVAILHSDNLLHKSIGSLLYGELIKSGLEDVQALLVMEEYTTENIISSFISDRANSGTAVFVMQGYCKELREWAKILSEVREETGLRMLALAYDFDPHACRYEGDTKSEVEAFHGIWNVQVEASASAEQSSQMLSDSIGDFDFTTYLSPPYGTTPYPPEIDADIVEAFEAMMGLPSTRTMTPGGVSQGSYAPYLIDSILLSLTALDSAISDLSLPAEDLSTSIINRYIRSTTLNDAFTSDVLMLNAVGDRVSDISIRYIDAISNGDGVMSEVKVASYNQNSGQCNFNEEELVYFGGYTGDVPGTAIDEVITANDEDGATFIFGLTPGVIFAIGASLFSVISTGILFYFRYKSAREQGVAAKVQVETAENMAAKVQETMDCLKEQRLPTAKTPITHFDDQVDMMSVRTLQQKKNMIEMKIVKKSMKKDELKNFYFDEDESSEDSKEDCNGPVKSDQIDDV